MRGCPLPRRATRETLDGPGLRNLLNTLHPLSDTELEKLMREKKIDHRVCAMPAPGPWKRTSPVPRPYLDRGSEG
ncbi:hypothetical protein FGD71_016470 [Streptomyces sporangiiformans]|uniref:Uncharacterized protein n=1 Tax=Streptomyces sporangiiformans TaxID=2315329 RepID=A0A505DM75_9ACTN|nr:hypothetical protein FGD71_016470 [Streptomyces sporangiiformans]